MKMDWACNWDSNFLEETMDIIKSCGKTEQDIKWVGNYKSKVDWETFKTWINFNYDSGFGCNFIDLGIVIVGKDWWLERSEYDGAEQWDYKELPSKPVENDFTFADLICESCRTNSYEDEYLKAFSKIKEN